MSAARIHHAACHAGSARASTTGRKSWISHPAHPAYPAHLVQNIRVRTRRDLLRLGVVVLAGTQFDKRAQAATPARADDAAAGVKALVFDTFGTVVDYRSSI